MAKRIIYYKCPFSCNKKYDREKLVRHVDDHHQNELPEGFSALRYVFHYVNNKPITYHGICTECKGPTPWDENIGRYKRQCGRKECHDSYVKKFEENMVKKTGHKRVTETQKGLEEMLKRRKISGKYTFQNGKQKEYVGSYEKKCLEFMDKVMNIDPDDIMAPGPTMEYVLDGVRHYYITDFYYQPYNLIIEVKDGGDNPNNRNMPEYRKKQMAKEKFIIDNTDYNYIRLTNNDMGQLLTVMADLKMQLVDGSNDRVIHVNEAGYRTDPYEITIRKRIENNITEKVLFNEPDIYYNKDKFDNGEINICFITGLSGSGKSTMARGMEEKGVEKYELDDVFSNFWFTDENLKEYGDLIYSFFKGVGKKYRMTKEPDWEGMKNGADPWYTDEFEKGMCKDFVKYSIQYAKTHKNKSFVVEGVELYWFIDPSELKDYAVYIKGTSAFLSRIRGAIRDSSDAQAGRRFKAFLKVLLNRNRAKAFIEAEKNIKKWREYYNGLAEKKTVNESRTVKSKFKAYDINDNEVKKYIMNDSYIRNYADYLKENTGEIIIDPNAKKVVGYVFIGDKKDKGFISTLEVKPEYRKQGFGTILIQDAVKLYGAIDLVVLKSNQVAVDLYTKNGFEVYKEIEHENQPAYWMRVKKQVVSEASTSEFNDNIEKNIIMNAEKLKKEEKYFTEEKTGIVNFLIKIQGYKKWLRGRSELLLFKGNSILLSIDLDGKGYSLPGGGWNLDESHARAAQRECEEEVGYNCTTPRYVLTYAAKFPPKYWVRTKIPAQYWWYGEYTELFCAEYDGLYNQHVDKIDQDPFMKRNAKFYDINLIWNMLIPPHQKAIKRYFNKLNNPFSPTFIP